MIIIDLLASLSYFAQKTYSTGKMRCQKYGDVKYYDLFSQFQINSGIMQRSFKKIIFTDVLKFSIG